MVTMQMRTNLVTYMTGFSTSHKQSIAQPSGSNSIASRSVRPSARSSKAEEFFDA